MDNNLKITGATKLLLKHLQARDAHKYKLFCPLCSQRLEPLIIDTSVDEKEETIWWTCQGVRSKTCDFPLSMPSNVFWTTRNGQQIESDVVPLPNFHLLPAKFHHLYPAFFDPTQSKLGQTKSAPLPDRLLKRKADQPSFPQKPSKMIHHRLEPLASEQKKPFLKRKEKTKMSMDQCLEFLDSHVPYMPDQKSINARVGKQVTQQPKPTASNTVEWTDLRIGTFSNPPPVDNPNENLPSCSSESSNSLEPTAQSLPDAFNLQPLGDSELDKLVKENLLGLLRNKKLRKRKKKPKVKQSSAENTQQTATTTLDGEFPSTYTYEGPEDEFGFHDNSWFLNG